MAGILDEAQRKVASAQARRRIGADPDELQKIAASIAALGKQLDAMPAAQAPEPSIVHGEPTSGPERADLSRVAEALLRADGTLGLEFVLEEALCAVRAKVAYVVAPDESRGEFVTVAAVGKGADELAGQRIPLGEGVPAAAARERTPMLVSNPESPGEEAAHDVIAVPLLADDTLHGVLVVQDPVDEESFRTRDLQELTGLCRLVAAALIRLSETPVGAAAPPDEDTIDDILRMYAREIDERNPYTRGHSERVARYCEEMAKSLALDADSIRLVRRAALLHDVGKLLLPESIVRKEDRLNDEELELMRTHAVRAEKMVRRIAGLEQVAPLVRHHHERCDGTGYPDGIAGADLSLANHVLIVANAFDVMTSDRSYRQATSLLQALRVLQEEAGTKYDRRAVQALCCLDRAVLTAPSDQPVSLGSTVKGQGSASISILE
jgi:putative nucleotidyltransferase with HDIG domain